MNTPWTETVDLRKPLPEYPRPQLARQGWINLNGPWDYAITESSRFPKRFDGRIIVPFSPEAELSGVGRSLKADEYLWYRRSVQLPESFNGKRILLHFGAVDQTATVWVNDAQVAQHVGGYLPFEADVTDAIEDGKLTITVRVTDETEKGGHTRGKQRVQSGQLLYKLSESIWYTPQSGIWQTVWLEAVPEVYIKSLHITPDLDKACVHVQAELSGEGEAFAVFQGERYPLPGPIPVPEFEAWTPDNPKLYGFSAECGEDRVQSYFAMRRFSVEKDKQGKPRLFLNGEPFFHNGLLDQGYWPDGLYTAPCDAAMVYDISTAKAMGFNMLRKHIKVEPLRWYYHCDRLGMLVWQDMPNGGGQYNPLVVSAPVMTGIHLKDKHYWLFGRTDRENRDEFRQELTDMIRHLYNCPCIAMWVPFNEGWGQFDAAKFYHLIRKLDKTRTIDHASGWHDQGIGLIKSEHVYFKEYSYHPDGRSRAVVLSEFGGYSCRVAEHSFGDREFGYKRFGSPEQLKTALEELYQKQIRPAVEAGLAAAVYTQLSDVENEANGFLTYDRKVLKIDAETVREIVQATE